MKQAVSELDATAQAALVASGQVSALDLVEAAIARIEAFQPRLNILVSHDFEAARARARGAGSGPLWGVPFLIKDVLAYPGQRFTLGSRLFRQYVAPSGSPYTAEFDRAGLITLGKTTTSELGLLGSTESLLTGITRNPWSAPHSPMGSSGGAAAAVAAGLVPMAHGSDAGGSIRLPASVCGLFGFKPSRGRLRGTDVPDPLGLLSDHVLTRSVRDSALMLALTEDPQSGLGTLGHVQAPVRARLRIAVYTRTTFGREADREVRDALTHTISLCRSLGHEVVESDGPHLDGPALSNAFFTIAGAGIAQLADSVRPMLGRDPGPEELEPFTLALWQWYRSLGPQAMADAVVGVRAGAAALDAFLSDYDVVLCPTLPTLPPLLGTLAPTLAREELLRRTEVLAGFTAVYNMAGAPAMSVPLFVSAEGLPIGSHFAARVGADAQLLSLAYQLEEAAPWRDKRPAVHA